MFREGNPLKKCHKKGTKQVSSDQPTLLHVKMDCRIVFCEGNPFKNVTKRVPNKLLVISEIIACKNGLSNRVLRR